MKIDLWILAFSAVMVFVTIFMGFWSAKKSRTASDFFVAGRSVSVGWNASAISGEYLSAASFMGIAGMVMSSGYDALWYPVCYACGYLFLLLFIAGPLRRFGAYTIPDFAEGRFDSPLFRKIAVCFVLFIGFFYTMPQMKGAGVTLAYIFPGLPYWVGVLLVGAVITLNVALGGMKGITLVQAFQYWAKMFAISVTIFVLMAVYGHYGKQLEVNGPATSIEKQGVQAGKANFDVGAFPNDFQQEVYHRVFQGTLDKLTTRAAGLGWIRPSEIIRPPYQTMRAMSDYAEYRMRLNEWCTNYIERAVLNAGIRSLDTTLLPPSTNLVNGNELREYLDRLFAMNGLTIIEVGENKLALVMSTNLARLVTNTGRESWESSFVRIANDQRPYYANGVLHVAKLKLGLHGTTASSVAGQWTVEQMCAEYANCRAAFGWRIAYVESNIASNAITYPGVSPPTLNQSIQVLGDTLKSNGIVVQMVADRTFKFFSQTNASRLAAIEVPEQRGNAVRNPLPEKAPADSAWLSPFGPLTTKAAKAAKIPAPLDEVKSRLDQAGYLKKSWPAFPFDPKRQIEEAARKANPNDTTHKIGLSGSSWTVDKLVDYFVAYRLAGTNAVSCYVDPAVTNLTVSYPNDAVFLLAEFEFAVKEILKRSGVRLEVLDNGTLVIVDKLDRPALTTISLPAASIKKYSLLYTYSLIIALVCGTAGLPHILVRFYTNPDGVAAKRTTMWVMILIGVFYVFPPVFGVLGRNVMPDLYNGVSGVYGTDGIVLKLPIILQEKYGRLGSILSGVTCAGAFAAFMSTFSGLLVSMTGALAHDVYGRILKPKSSADQRLAAFKVCAVLIGGIAIVLGCFVEPLEINFMVGQAFAIAAASYFPLLFMSVWWRGMTMRGAATGMLTGGLCALIAVTLTNISNLALDKGPMGKVFARFAPMNDYWSHHPLLRILCEQPAIWTVPLAIGLMIVVSRMTNRSVPSDVRMKMLVLHAPENLGLKQEYIQEHQHGH